MKASICGPHTFVSFPFSFGDDLAPAFTVAFVMFVRVLADQAAFVVFSIRVTVIFGV